MITIWTNVLWTKVTVTAITFERCCHEPAIHWYSISATFYFDKSKLLWVARKIESNPYLSLTWLKLELRLSLAKSGVCKSLFVSKIIIVISIVFFHFRYPTRKSSNWLPQWLIWCSPTLPTTTATPGGEAVLSIVGKGLLKTWCRGSTFLAGIISTVLSFISLCKFLLSHCFWRKEAWTPLRSL